MGNALGVGVEPFVADAQHLVAAGLEAGVLAAVIVEVRARAVVVVLVELDDQVGARPVHVHLETLDLGVDVRALDLVPFA